MFRDEQGVASGREAVVRLLKTVPVPV